MKKLTQAQTETISYADVKIYIHETSGGLDGKWRIEAVSDFAKASGVKFEGSKISGLTLADALEIAKSSATGKAEICFHKPYHGEEG